MKFAACGLLASMALAGSGFSQDAGNFLVAGAGEIGAESGWSLLEVDRHTGTTLRLDPSLGSSALWQSAVVDFNGDGIDDLVIGLPLASPDGLDEAGLVAVIYGRSRGFDPSVELELADLDGEKGFLVTGQHAGQQLGWSVAGIGDFNGNGHDDLAIGSPGYRVPGHGPVGAVHVLFGGTEPHGRIDLDSIPTGHGWTLYGGSGSAALGFSLAGIGDFNGSGLTDLAVGDPDAWIGGNESAGSVLILFGSRAAWPAATSLDRMDRQRGLRVHGRAAGQFFGFSLSPAGDFYGNGFDDLLIGSPGTAGSTPDRLAGAAYLLSGGSQHPTGATDLLELPADRWLEMSAGQAGDRLGLTVGWLPRQQGGELVIGAPMTGFENRPGSGAIYLVGGGQGLPHGHLDLADPGALAVIQLSGAMDQDRFGWTIDLPGDLNRDGSTDLVSGGPTGRPGSRHQADSTRHVHLPGRSIERLDESARTLAADEAARSPTALVFDARGLTRGRGTANWAVQRAGRLAGGQRQFVIMGERALHASVTGQAARLHVHPAGVRDDHGPVINGGDGIANQVLRAGESISIDFTVTQDGQNPDDFDYDVIVDDIAGQPGELDFSFEGAGEDRTLIVDSPDPANVASLRMVTVTVADTDGNVTQAPFVLGFSHLEGPDISVMPYVRTYDNMAVEVPFTVTTFSFVGGGSSNEDVVEGSFVEVEATPPNGTLSIPAVGLNPGQTVIWVYAEDVNGAPNNAYSGFILDIFGPADPYVNDGEGFVSPMTVVETRTLPVAFTIGDLVFEPDELEVEIFSSDPDRVSEDDMVLECIGADCLLEITPPMSAAGVDPVEISVRVCQQTCAPPAPDEGESRQVSDWPFDLEITERPPPTINDGEGIVDQALVEGQSLTLAFTIEDEFDESDVLLVEVVEEDGELDPGVFGLDCVDELCELAIDTELGMARAQPYVITVGVENPFTGLVGLVEFELTVEVRLAPVINDGEALADLVVDAGTVVEVNFPVSDQLDDPEALVVQAQSGDTGLLPHESLSLPQPCPAGQCTLSVDVPETAEGTVAVLIEAVNSDGLLSLVSFQLDIQPVAELPLINDGNPLSDLTVYEGLEQTIRFPVIELVPTGTLEVEVLSSNPSVLGAGDLALADAGGGDYELTLSPRVGAIGMTEITVLAGNLVGLVEALFSVEVLARPAPMINQSAGISNVDAAAGSLLEIVFSVSDLIDAPGDITVAAASGATWILPDDALSLSGTASQRTLAIALPESAAGSVPVTVTAINTAGRSRSTTFSIHLVEGRSPPLINQGAPLPDRVVPVGGELEVEFSVSDVVDAPELLLVSAESSNQEVLADDALEVSGTESARVLHVDASAATPGTTLITIEAINSGAVSSLSTFELVITEGPLTSLALTPELIDAPGPDQYVALAVETTGTVGAQQLLLDVTVSGDYEVVGGYSLAPSCSAADGAVSCALDLVAPWFCQVDGLALSCTLPGLPEQAVATAVLHVAGTGPGLVEASISADNATPDTAELTLED